MYTYLNVISLIRILSNKYKGNAIAISLIQIKPIDSSILYISYLYLHLHTYIYHLTLYSNHYALSS